MALAQACRELLKHFSDSDNVWIALSGGADSVALLHVIYTLQKEFPNQAFKAIHIHHGLNKNANQWQQFCENLCTQFDIDFDCIYVDAKPILGQSPEEAARQARYKALTEIISANDVVLTAHHQDDQAETFLLMLCRGSGLAGLSAMPMIKSLGVGFLARPFLNISRKTIQKYLNAYNLQYIHDDSNDNCQFDRNFIRHEILPLLEKRYPAIKNNLARTSQVLQNEKALVDDITLPDFVNGFNSVNSTLSCEHLLQLRPLAEQSTLNDARIFAVLRHWCQQLNIKPFSYRQCQLILQEIVHAKIDARPKLIIGEYAIRRFQQYLYLTKANYPSTKNIILNWDLKNTAEEQILQLPSNLGTLIAKPTADFINNYKLSLTEPLTIRFRAQGEAMRLSPNGPTKTLKHLMQEWQIPPWLRDQIPLVYLGKGLVGIVGYSMPVFGKFNLLIHLGKK